MLRLLNRTNLPLIPRGPLRLSVAFHSMRQNSSLPSQQATEVDTTTKTSESSSAADSAADMPWYLREDITNELQTARKVELPEIPTHAPPQVEEFVNLLAVDYGMDDIHLFDMTELPEDHEFKENNKNIDFIIISTGKSEKHIYKAANELRTHVKHKYNTIPLVEGMVSSAKTPAMRRRLLRRARKGPLATDNDYGRAANSWVLCSNDGVDVHMLTAPRREELNLESLWCKPEDSAKYAPQVLQSVESDNIFSGIRRFHTMTRFSRLYSLNSANLESYLYQLNSKRADLDDESITQLKNIFEDAFQNASLQDHHIRYQFWKSLHLLRPGLFSFQDAENALLEKYASEHVEAEDWSLTKIDDVVEYAKLLLDTPTRQSDKTLSDDALDKLSQFVSTLYQFSSEKLSLSANPALLPLLWRLCYLENVEGAVLTPKLVDEVIHQEKPITVFPPAPLISMASNNLRDVLCLVEYHTQNVDVGSVPTNALNELILFTYGNAGKWDKFWEQWETMWFSKSVEPSLAVERWTRLAVYLCSRGDRANMRKFLVSYWNNTSSVSGSFLGAFEANGNLFNSAKEASAFRRAVQGMISSFGTGGETPFDGISEYVENLVYSK